MNQRERYNNVFNFKKVDRVPNVEIGPWYQTVERWKKEGMPANIESGAPVEDKQYSRGSREMCEYFKIDAHIAKLFYIDQKTIPEPTEEVLEEDDITEVIRFSDGNMIKRLKAMHGVYSEYSWAINSRDDWEKTKKLIYPGWHQIGKPENMPSNDRDYAAAFDYYGLFYWMRKWMGFEAACLAFYDDPDLVNDMFDFTADYIIEMSKVVFKHFIPDFIIISEDMSYKTGSMVSPEIYKKFFVPRYRKVTDFLNSAGVSIVGIDSDGLFDELIPFMPEAGLNFWMPIEAQCREGKEDVVSLAKKYPWLRLMGGMDKRILNLGKEAIDKELLKIRPLVERGGVIPTLDHSIPPCPLENYRYYIEQKIKLLDMTK